MMAECLQSLGGLDVLVNNAGISGPIASVEEMDPDEWEKIMAVDLTGTLNPTQLFSLSSFRSRAKFFCSVPR